MGGSKIAVDHYLYNCVAFENANHGFTDNSNPGHIYLTNCTSFNNALDGRHSKKSNFDFARDSALSDNTLENCLSYTDNKIASDKFRGTVNNSALYNNKPMYYYYKEFPFTYWNDKEGVTLPQRKCRLPTRVYLCRWRLRLREQMFIGCGETRMARLIWAPS